MTLQWRWLCVNLISSMCPDNNVITNTREIFREKLSEKMCEHKRGNKR
jgi:hypothetical protein